MITEALALRDYNEEQKLMSAIHDNYQKANTLHKVMIQKSKLKQIKKNETEIFKSKLQNVFGVTMLILLYITLFILAIN